MRLTVLAAALLALGASGAHAQNTDPQSLELPVHGRRPDQTVEAPVQMQRPADVVAELAREALYGDESSESLKALATALPDFAIAGGADIEGTFAAARVADSLAAKMPLAPAGTNQAATEGSADLWSWIPALGSSEEWLRLIRTPAFAGSVAALLMFAILVWGLRRRRTPASKKHAPAVAKPRGRLWTARTLASSGAQISEIAERTGMAQEAVHLALRLAGVGAVQTWDDGRPHRQSVRVAPSRADLQLERDVLAGSNRLRDRVLTYGGVAR